MREREKERERDSEPHHPADDAATREEKQTALCSPDMAEEEGSEKISLQTLDDAEEAVPVKELT